MSSIKASDKLASVARKVVARFDGSSLRMRESRSQLLICSVSANDQIRRGLYGIQAADRRTKIPDRSAGEGMISTGQDCEIDWNITQYNQSGTKAQ